MEELINRYLILCFLIGSLCAMEEQKTRAVVSFLDVYLGNKNAIHDIDENGIVIDDFENQTLHYMSFKNIRNLLRAFKQETNHIYIDNKFSLAQEAIDLIETCPEKLTIAHKLALQTTVLMAFDTNEDLASRKTPHTYKLRNNRIIYKHAWKNAHFNNIQQALQLSIYKKSQPYQLFKEKLEQSIG